MRKRPSSRSVVGERRLEGLAQVKPPQETSGSRRLSASASCSVTRRPRGTLLRTAETTARCLRMRAAWEFLLMVSASMHRWGLERAKSTKDKKEYTDVLSVR